MRRQHRPSAKRPVYGHDLGKRLQTARTSRFFITISTNVRPGDVKAGNAQHLLETFEGGFLLERPAMQELINNCLVQDASPPWDVVPGSWSWWFEGQQIGMDDQPAAVRAIEAGTSREGGRYHIHFSVIVRQTGGRVFFDLPVMKRYVQDYFEWAQANIASPLGYLVQPGDPRYIPRNFWHINVKGSRTGTDVRDYLNEMATIQQQGIYAQYAPRRQF